MTHAWGGNPGTEAAPETHGANTGRLTDVERDYDPYSGIPRMSAIAVRLRRLAPA